MYIEMGGKQKKVPRSIERLSDGILSRGQSPKAGRRLQVQWFNEVCHDYLHIEAGNADWPAQQAGRFDRWHTDHNIPTPRAASNTTIASEIKPWVIIPSFADRDRTAVSVGENAVLVLKARKR